MTDDEKIVIPAGQRERQKWGLRWGLRLLKIPGLRWLGRGIVMGYLPECEKLGMQGGLKIMFGNIEAKGVSLCDTFFQDYARVRIGEGTSFSYQCMVLTGQHDFDNDFQTIIARPVEIGKHVWIASRVIILGGSKIGDGSVIAAGSVVQGEIPAGVLAGGMPAKVIRKIAGGIKMSASMQGKKMDMKDAYDYAYESCESKDDD